jgi:16S rRNA (uracil1498-N3)-methyltransferase
MSVPRFVVATAALAGSQVVLEGSELRHLRVRRVRVGDTVALTDGAGCERYGVLVALDRQRAVIELSATALVARELPVRLTLALALLKGDKTDLVVEKATELGAHAVVLFTSERTVGRAGAERRERWTRLARSAAKQSGRAVVPSITGPIAFRDLLAATTDPLRLVLWERAAPGGLGSVWQESALPASVTVAVGPEGGFADTEIEAARAAGFLPVGLRSPILRAETAAIAAVTLCAHLWDMRPPVPAQVG